MPINSIKDVLGTLSRVHITWFTQMFGQAVGTDVFGNKYFKRLQPDPLKPERRWVVYSYRDDASEVPPEWHGWLHYQTDLVPENQNPLRRKWQKPYVANMTGTGAAYLPPGHALAGSHRAAATGDYEAWKPE